jgi:ribonuclease R
MPPAKKSKDPQAKREAARYDNPIPSREYILEHLEERSEPLTHLQLSTELLLFDNESQEALRRRLRAMIRDGQLIENRGGAYGLVRRMDLIKGTIQGNKEGFGFMIPDDGSADLFLNPNQMKKAFDGDTVLAKISGHDRRGRLEGKIVEVLERKRTEFVGRFYRESGMGVVIPHNRRITQEILIPPKKHKNAKDGDFVVVKVTRFAIDHVKSTGIITEVLGDIARPGMEIEVAIRAHDIPRDWPKGITTELNRISKTQSKPSTEAQHRIDLRELPFVTIDGEDAKDFDDAVYCQNQRGRGWTLYVAIADVSHYVQPDSILDGEAKQRGNSVYFPGHVIPMLPEDLSNGLCSLKPHEDRLVMVCQMNISREGNISSYKFYEGIIHSQARLTYTEVAGILQPAKTDTDKRLQARLRDKHGTILGHLQHLYALYKTLYQSRRKHGALDFETTETRIIFSEQKKIKEIVPVMRNDAHRLIEECMLCANVCAAEFLLQAKLPALYRVHDGPNEEKVAKLYDFLRGIGIGLARKRKPSPRDYQLILDRLSKRPDRQLIQTIVIRSLQQAIYQPNNCGHFGLGFEAYTHFTSPIRRYPDLLVHRGIRYLIRSDKFPNHTLSVEGTRALTRKEIYPYKVAELENLGAALSMTERRADAATYDVLDWLKCEYVKEHIGEEYEGTVTSVTSFGLFVQLDDLYVEGLVHVTALHNDYYHFDAIAHTLTGEATGNQYQMGDKVSVIVARVDLDDKKIDLQLTGSRKSTTRRKQLPQRQRSGKPRDKARKYLSRQSRKRY